jgi:hypothetical protein
LLRLPAALALLLLLTVATALLLLLPGLAVLLLLLLRLAVLLALLRLTVAALLAVTHGFSPLLPACGYGLTNQRVDRARFPAFEPICGLRRTVRSGVWRSFPFVGRRGSRQSALGRTSRYPADF